MITHIQQGWQYEDAAKTVAVLKDLGITHVRDAFVGVGHSGLEHAARSGIKFTVNISPGWELKILFPRLEAWVRKYPDSIVAIEGPNEVNNWPVTYQGQTGIGAAQAFQRDLYAGVKSRPLLKHIPVVGVTSWPVFQNESDLGNVHAYDRSGNYLTRSIVAALKDESEHNPGKPIWMTEAGYHTRLGNDNYHEGVSEAVQSKMVLSMFMSAFELGIPKTFYYQLADQYTDPKNQESFFGLVDQSWNPKPAYHAQKNTIVILKQGGDAPAPSGALAYGLENLPSTGRHKLFRVADGDWLLAVWNEPDIWDENNNVEIENPVSTVTLRLQKPSSMVRIFDPLLGVDPVTTATTSDSIKFELDDHPVFLRIRAAADPGEPVPQRISAAEPPDGQAFKDFFIGLRKRMRSMLPSL
jgi:hypothetical protein